MRIRTAVFGHPYIVGLVALLGAGLTVFVLAYFEPQKLFIDDKVDEALPVAPAPSTAPSQSPAKPAAPPRPAIQTLSTGSFRSYEHSTDGRAKVIELANGQRYLRFDDFTTSNGPDVRVYLSTTPASGPGDAFDDDYVELGELKGNIGNQNYAIPTNADLGRFKSAVIWCKRFSVPFGAAAVS